MRQNRLMPNITLLQGLLCAEILVELKNIWKKIQNLWFGVNLAWAAIISQLYHLWLRLMGEWKSKLKRYSKHFRLWSSKRWSFTGIFKICDPEGVFLPHKVTYISVGRAIWRGPAPNNLFGLPWTGTDVKWMSSADLRVTAGWGTLPATSNSRHWTVSFLIEQQSSC